MALGEAASGARADAVGLQAGIAAIFLRLRRTVAPSDDIDICAAAPNVLEASCIPLGCRGDIRRYTYSFTAVLECSKTYP